MENLGALYQNLTASGLVVTGQGKIYGIIVNSHSNGTIRLNDSTVSTAANSLAIATLTSDATNVSDAETVKIGQVTYRFKNTMAQAYDVKIGASAAVTLDNLKAAINASGTPGVEYYTGTLIHPSVTAETNTDTTQVIQAKTAGICSITVSEASAHLSWDKSVLAGANIVNTITLATGPQVLTFPTPINFSAGLYLTVGGTLDCTLVFN